VVCATKRGKRRLEQKKKGFVFLCLIGLQGWGVWPVFLFCRLCGSKVFGVLVWVPTKKVWFWGLVTLGSSLNFDIFLGDFGFAFFFYVGGAGGFLRFGCFCDLGETPPPRFFLGGKHKGFSALDTF